MTLRPLAFALFVPLFFCLAPPVQAIKTSDSMTSELANFSLGIGFEYGTGDYGTTETVNTWRIPLLIEWTPLDRLSLSIEIPYVHQSSSGETVLIGGVPTPTGSGRGKMTDGSMTDTTSVVRSTTSVGGLGDITLNAAFTLFTGGVQAPQLDALLYAKLPTADEEQGLGTGEFDWGSGLGLRKRFGDWALYAEALAVQPGTSDVYSPEPYWDWLVALNYRTTSSLQTGLSLSGGTASFAGVDDPLEVKASLGGISGDLTSFSVYVAHGLSDSSQDWGVGIFGYVDF